MTESTAERAPLSLRERVNFAVTNGLPRRWLTLLLGRFSKIENRWLARASIWLWSLFVDDLRLEEAEKTHFKSLHDCFTRKLKPGARPLSPDARALISPCDAVIGAFGDLAGLEALQAKGSPYSIEDLLGGAALAERYRDGRFVTLRLKSSMYHRFHAPADCRLSGVNYISGDVWNVNPPALRVVDRLFCKNERVVFDLEPQDGPGSLTLVAVAAILVASVRVHGLPHPLNLRYRGPNHIALEREYRKGEEMGYFEHGSTIVALFSKAFDFAPALKSGQIIRMGQPLLLRQLSA